MSHSPIYEVVDAMLLSSEWVLTLGQHRRSDDMLFELRHIPSRLVVGSVRPSTAAGRKLHFHAAWQKGGKELLLASYSVDQGAIEVYSLRGSERTFHDMWTMKELFTIQDVFDWSAGVSVTQHMITYYCTPSTLCLVNTITRRRFCVPLPEFENAKCVVPRIAHDLSYVALISGHFERDGTPEQMLRVYSLPSHVVSTLQPTVQTQGFSSDGPPIERLELPLRDCYTSPLCDLSKLAEGFSIAPNQVSLDFADNLWVSQAEFGGRSAYSISFHIGRTIQTRTPLRPLEHACDYFSPSSKFCNFGERGFFKDKQDGKETLYVFSHTTPGPKVAVTALPSLLSSQGISSLSYDESSGRMGQVTSGQFSALRSLRIIDFV
ncbi:hypothetical protein ONZ45_g2953 [Pleurotus djamor]|nr:hypothetical protein ONZ45_g2953 [Pleurotus djamor]